MEERYLSYPEAAARLGLNLNTLYSLVHSRRIPHVRLGSRLVRFSEKALAAWLDRNTVAEDEQAAGQQASESHLR